MYSFVPVTRTTVSVGWSF